MLSVHSGQFDFDLPGVLHFIPNDVVRNFSYLFIYVFNVTMIKKTFISVDIC